MFESLSTILTNAFSFLFQVGMRENVLKVLAEHKMTLESLEERGTGGARAAS